MRRKTVLIMSILPILVLLALGAAPADKGPGDLAPVPSIGADPAELMVIPSDTLGATAVDTTEAKQVEAEESALEKPGLADKVRKGISAVRIMTRVAAGLLGEWIADEVIHPD